MIKSSIKNKNYLLSRSLETFTFLLLLLVFFFLNYQQVFTDSYESDTIEHIEILKQYFANKKYIPHPLWHYGTYLVSLIFHISIKLAATIFSSILMLSWTLIIYLFNKNKITFKTQTESVETLFHLLLMLCIVFLSALVIPGDHLIYLGKGGPSIWHNITIWMVKPFAFFTIVFTFLALKNNNKKDYIYAFIFAIISLFAKPSFIIIFLPALFVVTLMNKYYNKTFLLYFFMLSFTSISILIYQLLNTFSNSEIVVDFLGVWSRYSSNISLSIFLGLAFPITFSLLNKKTLNEPIFQLLWIQTFFGIILYSCFAQAGEQYTHGNFAWSYLIAMNLLYLFTIVRFIKNYYILSILKRSILAILLFIQTVIGFYYFFRILQGQNPLYISIFFLR